TSGELEARILDVWKGVLKLADVGATDSFFEVGGHSLALVKVQAGIEKATGVRIPLAEFFKHSTVRELAALVAASLGVSAEKKSQAVAPDVFVRRTSDDAVAIVGMAIRAPKSPGLEAYWDNLKAGRECISRFEEDECDPWVREAFAGAGDAWVRAGGLID